MQVWSAIFTTEEVRIVTVLFNTQQYLSFEFQTWQSAVITFVDILHFEDCLV